MKLSEIKINPNNPQKFTDLSKLENSIKEFPKMMELRPLVVDNNNMVLGGNKRLVCLKNLGYKEIPDTWVKSAQELTEAEQKRFIIADNVGFGEWDWEVLSDWDEPLKEWGLDIKVFDGDSEVGWNPDKTDEAELGDGINELVGYGLQSFWKDITNNNCPVFEYQIELPMQGKTNLVRQKYSRTNLESIQRVVKTYMRDGDYFLESCVGWATFSSVAKYFGFSGVGTDIWDVSLAHCKQQLAMIKTDASVDIKYGDAMNLPFDNDTFDFVYCNPPFMDEEKYSGSDNDIATNNDEEFAEKFIKLMQENYRVLKSDNLCVITINDKREKGILIPLQSKVIEWGIKAGFKLWDFVIAEVLSQKIRLRKKDYELRRTVKCHEYVIVFKKL